MKKGIFVLVILPLLLLAVLSCKKDCSSQDTSCRISHPLNEQEITKGETITISVDDDNPSSSLDEVRFYIDGVGKSSLTSFPYNYQWVTLNESLGNHTIFIKSFGSNGEQCTHEITVVIIDGEVGNDIPVTDFTATPLSGISPLSVTFSDKTANNPTSWQWSFGDGGTSTEQNPVHNYTTNGLYSITLLASNSHGSDTLTRTNYISIGGSTTGVPCPETPTITDSDGNIYNTVLIGNQCWMKENLNVGNFIHGITQMTNNSVIEKYCMDDNQANCNTYGGLYQWDELMNYTNTEGAQGICPEGWHIPSDQDWKELEIHLGISPAEADSADWRGENEGNTLKTTYGWIEGGNGTNTTGFSGLPGGFRGAETAGFGGVTEDGFWWTSTPQSETQIWYRHLGRYVGMINRTYNYKGSGISVRCIKD